jgi:hypothetical protein
MAWTKLKTAMVAGALALLAVGTATVTLEHAKATGGARSLAFAGYATPEASVQSTIWAAGTGDLEKLAAGATPEQMEAFKNKTQGKSQDEVQRDLVA